MYMMYFHFFLEDSLDTICIETLLATHGLLPFMGRSACCLADSLQDCITDVHKNPHEKHGDLYIRGKNILQLLNALKKKKKASIQINIKEINHEVKCGENSLICKINIYIVWFQ